MALSTLVLASLLSTEAFGVVALAWVYIQFIQMFVEQGFSAAIIQRKDLSEHHLTAVFWLLLGVCLVLAWISWLFAGWWAALNGMPELEAVVRVLSLMLPIQALTIVQQALFQRRIDFRRLALCNLVSAAAGAAVGITLGLSDFGVWALVGQHLTKSFFLLVLLWQASHWRPGWRFSMRGMRELISFSVGSFGAKLGVFAASRADTYLMGVFFQSASVVGVYRVAESIMSMFLQLGTQALTSVSFPRFSQLQNDPDRLRATLRAYFKLNATAIIPPLFLAAAVSGKIMNVLGDRWQPAVTVLSILCVVGMLQSFTTFVGPLLMALGRPGTFARLLWFTAIVGNLTFAAAAYGLRGFSEETQPVGIAIVRLGLTSFLYVPLILGVVLRTAHISVRELLHDVFVPLCAGGAAYAIAKGFSYLGWGGDWPPLIQLGIEGGCGAVVGGVILLHWDHQARLLAGKVMAWVRQKCHPSSGLHS